MKKIEEIKDMLAEHKHELREEFKVKEMGVFGSYVRGKQKKTSDVDILVDVGRITLLKFIELENYLSDLIGVKVDLIMKTALKPRIGKHILKEVRYI
ncbi:MAG: hypothetical protein A7316_05630 [Candidatus Altiarchaeales archaeon WOR_SM1_86-2]|nr:MAG: hypothetical protein A7316_05630 [Candidatus Altiarchaeales archaeon WOR_SM1_86-2]ODS39547.1 MAG: hypothetical protein A7315_10900 [Candidatus Altiarchaeales archaeon WOR_SM1_79]